METLMWKGIAMISLIVSFIALIIGIVAVDKATVLLTATTIVPQVQQPATYPTSCRTVKQKSSGLYMIRPNPKAPPFQVYCDGQVDPSNGKWTLVASIHENNIDGKCSPGDKWSSEQGRSKDTGSNNWENRRTFGRIETLTNDDYKNPAYYSLNASDMMIWHVPNQKLAYEISKAATLKYYTKDMLKPKSTLQQYFRDNFPLTKAVGGLNTILVNISSQSRNITGSIPFWFNYNYDSGRTGSSIRDGGRDMYDGGNMVSFRTDRENLTRINYGSPYFLYGSDVEVKSAATYPFITLAWIGSARTNQDPSAPKQSPVRYFDFRVVSNYGADGRGNAKYYTTTTVITQGEMVANYTAFVVANATDPSICEVFFYISSASRWGSRPPQTIQRIGWRRQTREARNTVRFTGVPGNVLVGYTLLSKARGRTVLKTEIEAVLRKYMRIAESFVFKVHVPHHIVPVTFAKGNNATVMAGIPSLHRKHVKAGFIQIRAFNSVGLPNALCPGIAVYSDNPESMCVGGGSTAPRDIKQCGDFAGWKGNSGDPGSQTSPSRSGRSQNDINSSLLIFVR